MHTMKINQIKILFTICIFTGFCSEASHAFGFSKWWNARMPRKCSDDSMCAGDSVCFNGKCTGLCDASSLCGPNSYCLKIDHDVHCICSPGFIKGRDGIACEVTQQMCNKHSICSDNEACMNGFCSNPCEKHSSCAINAFCRTKNHVPICQCFSGYKGDPYNHGCLAYSHESKVISCENHLDCDSHSSCIRGKCSNKCSNHMCSANAKCTIVNHHAVCECITGFIGDPYMWGCSSREMSNAIVTE